MNTIESAYINALLADAAYVSIAPNRGRDEMITDLSGRMTPTQATFIANNFSVASSIDTTDNPLLGSGFDATVWRGREGTPFAGQVFVSMRGTEGVSDYLADGDLATSAGARTQIMDMVNWWLRETTPVGQLAKQIKWDAFRKTDPNPLSNAVDPGFVFDTSVAGTGTSNPGLVGVSNIQVDGHSLGGHLATAFARIFGANNSTIGSVNVQAVSTFNSAGFNGSSTEAIFQNIQSLLRTGINSFFPTAAKQTNFFGQNGPEVTTNTWWFNQMGQRIGLYQEDGLESVLGVPNTDPFSNHYMYKLTDLLALGAALEKLDANMTFANLNELVKAGSNDMKGSYEGVLDGLRRILIDRNIGPIPTGDVSDSASSRKTYHEVLKQLTDLFAEPSGTLKALAGKLTLSLPTTSLATTAKTDFAAFLSLNALSPVVISTTDAAAIAALKAANPTLATSWTADANARLYGHTTFKTLTAWNPANNGGGNAPKLVAARAYSMSSRHRLNQVAQAMNHSGWRMAA